MRIWESNVSRQNTSQDQSNIHKNKNWLEMVTLDRIYLEYGRFINYSCILNE